MKRQQSKFEMRKELLRHLETLEKLKFKQTFPRNSFVTPKTRLDVLIATSILKTKLNTEDLISTILDKKYFISLSIMRMVFEELILITFALSKLTKAKTLEDADHVLLRISVGKMTDLGRSDQLPPYNIHTTLEEAEKYIQTLSPDLKGIFDDTYTFISDQVHPNAPSRYYFMKRHGQNVRITYAQPTKDDVKMMLNHACLTLGLFMMIIKKLMEVNVESLKSKN